jgi:pimeloyl-ACP methyl ester carboxylesterase
MDPLLVRAFHGGYAACAALPDLFQWLSPALLRRLEASLAARRDAIEGIGVWWGGRDRVVTPEELRLTERALGVSWPLRLFEAWGHYPMLEDPRGWVAALVSFLQAPWEPPLTGGMKTTSSPSFSRVSKGA